MESPSFSTSIVLGIESLASGWPAQEMQCATFSTLVVVGNESLLYSLLELQSVVFSTSIVVGKWKFLVAVLLHFGVFVGHDKNITSLNSN